MSVSHWWICIKICLSGKIIDTFRHFACYSLLSRLWIFVSQHIKIIHLSLFSLHLSWACQARVKGRNMMNRDFVVNILACEIFFCLELRFTVEAILISYHVVWTYSFSGLERKALYFSMTCLLNNRSKFLFAFRIASAYPSLDLLHNDIWMLLDRDFSS